MSFLCPDCSTAGTLKIVSRLELPPDSRSDEITLQIVQCSRCGFEGIAVYEESRRGAMGGESVDHRGYYVSESDLQELKQQMKKCPSPRNARCACAVHRRLGGKDASGRWDGLADIETARRFVI